MGGAPVLELVSEGVWIEGLAHGTAPTLRVILDSVPVGISYFDQQERFQFANKQYERLLRVSVDTLLGTTLEQAIGTKPYRTAGKFAKRALRGETVCFENTLPKETGDPILIRVTYLPNVGPGNVVDGFFALVEDITDRKRLEEELLGQKEGLKAEVQTQTAEIREAYLALELKAAEHSRAEEQYKGLLQAAPDPTVYVDTKGIVLETNAELERVFGYSRDEFIGQNINTLVPESRDGEERRERRRFLSKPYQRFFGAKRTLLAQGKDGADIPVEISVNPAEFQGPQCLIVSLRDISVRQEAQEALKASEARLRILLESTHAIPWESDDETRRYTYIGPQVADLLGYPQKQWLDEEFWPSHIHPDDKKTAEHYCRKTSVKCDHFSYEYRMIAKNGRTVWLQDIVNVIRKNGGVTGLRGFILDITERKRTETVLRDLGARLIAAQEDEQKRIARELHDNLSQELALIAVELDLLGADVPRKNRAAISTQLARIQEMAREASSAVHKMSHQLHPAMLDQLGLGAAVAGYCNEISARQGPQIDFKNIDVLNPLPADLSLCLYRILQESVQNALKHSGADEIKVRLFRQKNEVCLTVQDKGCGFQFDPDGEYGLGLTSMSERMGLIGGDFRISSEPGKGTTITACKLLETET